MPIEWAVVRDATAVILGLGSFWLQLLPRPRRDLEGLNTAAKVAQSLSPLDHETAPLVQAAYYRALRRAFYRDRTILRMMQAFLVISLGFWIMEVGRPYEERLAFVVMGLLVVLNGMLLFRRVFDKDARSRAVVAMHLESEERQLLDSFAKASPASKPSKLDAHISAGGDAFRKWINATRSRRVTTLVLFWAFLIAMALLWWPLYVRGV